MLRILHLADLHLGWEPSYLSADKKEIRCRERDRLLKKAVDYALSPEGDIHAVLLVGDLFEDYNPGEVLVKQVMEQISRLTRAGVLVVTVPGNHDEITYRESVYRRFAEQWPGSLVTNSMPELAVSTEINGTRLNIYSLAFTGGATRPEAIEAFPRSNEAGLHIGAFHGSLDWHGVPDRSLPLNSSLLVGADYDLIALGHYHRFMEKQIGKGKAIYPGSVEFKSFNDPGTGYLTVEEVSAGHVKIDTIPLDIRRYQIHSLDLAGINSPQELSQACRDLADEELMLQLNLTGTPGFPVNTESLNAELEPYFFYLEINNYVQYFAESFLENIAQESTVRGAYVRRMREKQEKVAAGWALKEVIHEWSQEEVTDEWAQEVLKRALLKGMAALEGSDL